LTLLDDSSFDEATVDDPWLIGFTCSSNECEQMEDALSSVQRTHSLHLRVGLVDCDVSTSLCSEHSVQAPSTILFYKERGFLFSGEFTSDNYLLFVGETFKVAASRDRVHLSLKRRLAFNSLNRLSVQDFIHQHRYLLTVSVAFFLLLWGVFIGSALATSPSMLFENFNRQQARQQKQTAATEKKKK
jgi:hypothetical protein